MGMGVMGEITHPTESVNGFARETSELKQILAFWKVNRNQGKTDG